MARTAPDGLGGESPRLLINNTAHSAIFAINAIAVESQVASLGGEAFQAGAGQSCKPLRLS